MGVYANHHTWVSGEIVTETKMNNIEDRLQLNTPGATNVAEFWDNTKTYSKGDYVVHIIQNYAGIDTYGYLYKSKIDNNLGNVPAATTNISWEKIDTLSFDVKKSLDENKDLRHTIIEDYDSTESYQVGDYVYYTNNGSTKLYKCKQAQSAGGFVSSKWDEIQVLVDIKNNLTTLKTNIDNDLINLENIIANDYNDTQTYNIGDYIYKKDDNNNIIKLYKCISSITTPEAWTAAHWSETSVMGNTKIIQQDIVELESQTNELENDISRLENDVDGLNYAINETLKLKESTEADIDLDVADASGNVLVRFIDGNIHTKSFNSTSVNTDINNLKSQVSGLGNDINDLEIDVSEALKIKESLEVDSDLDVADESGNVLVRFIDGNIYTSEFDSTNINEDISNLKNQVNGGLLSQISGRTNVDLDISDTGGNVVLRLKNGGIETKKFNSNYIRQMQGLKWACVGDSLTEHNRRTTMNYHDYIAEETGITIINMGHSGCGYAKIGAYGKNFMGIVEEIPNDVDVITIFGSCNDMGAGLALGTPTDTGTTTLCGCINTTLSTIYTNHMTTPLGIITPTPLYAAEPSDGDTPLSLYSDAIAKICELRGIPCLNLFYCSNLHPNDSAFKNAAYSKDEGGGTHPDETGHKIITPRFRQFLFSLI